MPARCQQGRSAFEGGGVEPKCPGIVDKLAGDPLVVLVALTIAAEDQPIRCSRSQLGDKAHQIGAAQLAHLVADPFPLIKPQILVADADPEPLAAAGDLRRVLVEMARAARGSGATVPASVVE